jgi:hypothetical protein
MKRGQFEEASCVRGSHQRILKEDVTMAVLKD